jgi:gliding motility-associated-like protein
MNIRSILSTLLVLVCAVVVCRAQLPVCNNSTGGGLIYMKNFDNIFVWDPSVPMSATNPSINTINMAAAGSTVGFAVSENLNAATPAMTFYTVNTVTNTYWYHNGTTWVNTGHTASAVNIGAGGGYIFNFNATSNQVFRYDGTGNDVLIGTVAGYDGGGPFDVSVDCDGNFYVIREVPPAWVRKYDANCNLLQQWDVLGAAVGFMGGGFGIVDNVVYYHNNSSLQSGVLGPTSVTLSVVPGSATFYPSGVDDFGSCPMGGLPPVMKYDTLYACDNNVGVSFTATGEAPFSYNVLSGSATVSNTGATFNIKPNSLSKIVINSSSNSICFEGQVHDTILVVPAPTLNAGPDKTLIGCNAYLDSLHATRTNETPWIDYSVSWQPMGSIVSGGNTLKPVINPTEETNYIITLTTPAEQGGCTWMDSVTVSVDDKSVMPDFTYDVVYGCNGDSVYFQNASLLATRFHWDFGDGYTDTVENPAHRYASQGSYYIKLVARNPYCVDSAIQNINLLHPLAASITSDLDTVCENGVINFTNTSVTTTIGGQGPAYRWNFGDGSPETTSQHASHTYTNPGVYQVRMIVTDFVPCSDTAFITVVVDSFPTVLFTRSDTAICTGNQITFTGAFTGGGLSSLTWEFGDGDSALLANPVHHSYLHPGVYNISLRGDFRACPSQTQTAQITVLPMPVIYLGPDTSICLDGSRFTLEDQVNGNDQRAKWLWSTGDTTSYLHVLHHGIYSATVTIEGCSATDEVEVIKDCYVDIPNSFTPNNDGVNDYFLPRQLLSKGAAGFSMQVFNRWGQLMFETRDNIAGRGWDGKFNGKDQPTGAYVYSIKVLFKNGQMENYTGNVTLLR